MRRKNILKLLILVSKIQARVLDVHHFVEIQLVASSYTDIDLHGRTCTSSVVSLCEGFSNAGPPLLMLRVFPFPCPIKSVKYRVELPQLTQTFNLGSE